MKTSSKPIKHVFLAKATWRSTALKLKIEAKNAQEAWHRAWGKVSRMEGGGDCLSVIILEQLR